MSIVGGGPAGLTLGRKLAKNNIDVCIFEEDSIIGKPVLCAGLVSKNIKDVNNFSDRLVLNKIIGAKLYAPDGKCLRISRGNIEAYVIDRFEYDRFLEEKAIEAGAKIYKSRKVISATRGKIYTADGTVFSQYIVSAEGFYPKIAKELGFSIKHRYLQSSQFIMNVKPDEIEQDYVELFFGNKIAPGFFAWVIPENDSIARVGVATNKPFAIDYLRNFIKDRFSKGSWRDLQKGGGYIPISGPVNKTATEYALLLGDVAGQIKPTTGGGLVIHSICADSAFRAIKRENLLLYERFWRDNIEKELKVGLLIRKFMDSMNDRVWNKLFRFIDEYNIIEDIVTYGDMDFPSRLFYRLLLRPAFFWLIIRNILDFHSLVEK